MKMNDSSTTTFASRVELALTLAVAWTACAATSARADLVFGIADGTATPGSSSNSFDVTLTNSGASDVDIAGFSFEITTTSSNVNFSDVTVYTQSAPYIFGAYSEFGPDIALSAAGNMVLASDNYVTPFEGATLASGQTLDLGHVLFALDLTAPTTPIPITFSTDPADTQVNDPDGNPFPNLLIPGPGVLTIPVGGVAVPEPASGLLGLQGLSLAGYIASRRRSAPRSRRGQRI